MHHTHTHTHSHTHTFYNTATCVGRIKHHRCKPILVHRSPLCHWLLNSTVHASEWDEQARSRTRPWWQSKCRTLNRSRSVRADRMTSRVIYSTAFIKVVPHLMWVVRPRLISVSRQTTQQCWSGVMVMHWSLNEVNQRRAQLVLGWVTISGFNSQCDTFTYVCNQPPRSTQPGHPFVGRCNEYQPKVAMPCSRGVKGDMVHVWVAGKTLWSLLTHGSYLTWHYKVLHKFTFFTLTFTLKPTIIISAAQHHHPLTSIKLYCLVIKSHIYK